MFWPLCHPLHPLHAKRSGALSAFGSLLKSNRLLGDHLDKIRQLWDDLEVSFAERLHFLEVHLLSAILSPSEGFVPAKIRNSRFPGLAGAVER